MRKVLVAVAAAGMFAALTGAAVAQSCFDLWYERNSIYDENGYCFSTELAQEYFDNDDCWTKRPKFSRSEQRQIEAIKEEEDDRGCRVN